MTLKLKRYFVSGNIVGSSIESENGEVHLKFINRMTHNYELWIPIEPGDVCIYNFKDYEDGSLDSKSDIGNWFVRIDAISMKEAKQNVLSMVEAELRCH